MIAGFIVDGRPIPKGRPRVTRNGTYTPKSTREYEQRVRAAWEVSGAVKFPSGTPISLHVYADFPIPKRTPKDLREKLIGTPYTAARGDIDNIVKAVMDALNGCAYEDDAFIVSISASKTYGDKPRTAVLLAEVEK